MVQTGSAGLLCRSLRKKPRFVAKCICYIDRSKRTVHSLFLGYPLRHVAERDSCHYGYYRIGYVRDIDGN
jgi:hypothetical protein